MGPPSFPNKYMNDTERIKYLSIDSAFGILTRPALELAMVDMPGDKSIFIIDFNNMHELNRQLGYSQVNQKVQEALKFVSPETNNDLLIGRVFSGDEIAIVHAKNQDWSFLMGLFQANCKHVGLGFKYAFRRHFITSTVQEAKNALDTMSHLLHETPLFSKVL